MIKNNPEKILNLKIVRDNLEVKLNLKPLQILKDGGQVNYQGATNVEFSDVGEASGSYKELEIGNGKFNTVTVR